MQLGDGGQIGAPLAPSTLCSRWCPESGARPWLSFPIPGGQEFGLGVARMVLPGLVQVRLRPIGQGMPACTCLGAEGQSGLLWSW